MDSYSFDAERSRLTLSAAGTIDLLHERAELTQLRAQGSLPLTFTFSRRPGERFAGLGERFIQFELSGRYRGTIHDLYFAQPEDTYFFFPLLLSSGGYGVALDSHADATWNIPSAGSTEWTLEVRASSVDLYLFRGSPKRVIELMTATFGRAPLAPPWVYGVWKTTLSGTEAVLRQGERLREAGIAASALWVYDHYDQALNSGCNFSGTYPAGEYPDHEALVRGIHDLGYRALGYQQPGLYKGGAAYEEAKQRGFLVKGPDGNGIDVSFPNPFVSVENVYRSMEQGFAGYVDFTNPQAAEWYQGLLAATLAQGWDGWMQDMGEHMPDEAVFADGTDGPEGRNRYPLDYHRAAYEVWSTKPDAAVFVRSGALGVVPYVSAVWPGDQRCDWSRDRGLPSALPSGPSAGLCGVAAWGPDIGGIFDGRNACDARDEELWLRWCQYGALNPVMRDHLGFKYEAGTPVDLWASAGTVAMFRTYADLHLRLFPFFYGLAREASLTGIPIVRALCLEYPEHDEAWWIADQYLLGDALLVAPVHEPGGRSRTVWFPPGEWLGWWDERRYSGPGWATLPAPLDEIPLFQRAGSVVPMLRQAPAGEEGLREEGAELHRA